MRIINHFVLEDDIQISRPNKCEFMFWSTLLAKGNPKPE